MPRKWPCSETQLHMQSHCIAEWPVDRCASSVSTCDMSASGRRSRSWAVHTWLKSAPRGPLVRCLFVSYLTHGRPADTHSQLSSSVTTRAVSMHIAERSGVSQFWTLWGGNSPGTVLQSWKLSFTGQVAS